MDMQEIRVLFSPAAGNGHHVSLTDGDGNGIGVEVPFTPFLTDDDFDNLRWYLEEYMELPDGGAVVRAERIEADIARWGHQLQVAIFLPKENRAALNALLNADEPRELTIATSNPALLRLPWELMSDSAGSLALRVSIRRQLTAPEALIPREVKLPLRILYLVSRPEDTGFIDPRVTTKALFAALDPLGAAVKLDFCRPPTLARMGEMLREAQQAGDGYDVVHFDGHGTFMPQQQLGALCFEKSDDGTGDSKTDLVPADQLGNLLAQHKIPLVVLEACRSAEMKTIVFRSVAPRLIQAGVGSVLSMGHAVHVEAAKILLKRFYEELASGTTIGHAVAQGRSALMASPARWLEYGPGARTLRLQDWFLPHLYQRGTDDPLLPPDLAKQQAVRQFDLFLSHNHNDSARVEALARTLSEKHGLRVWLDKWECDPGKLEPQCEAGIRNSRFTVVAGSQSALNSKWVEWEIKKHLELNPDADRLLPVKFEPLKLPPNLDGQLWVDFTDPAQDAENAALLARLIRTADAEDARRRRGFRPPARQRDEHGPFPPSPSYGFQGRARELLALERQFRTQRGIVLHAMGGMGKTTLATEAADWWTRSGLFRDGACFVSFEQFTSAERVVQVLGCYVAGEKFNQLPAKEQERRAIEIMQQRDVLLVWDNFESALPQFNDGAAAHGSPYTDEERTRLADLFRDLTTGPGRGCVLVTCRPGDTGLPGARRHELHGLARADSLWLLAEILQKHDLKLSDPRLTRDQLDPLLHDLADHPLSLELVGPHLQTLTPAAIRADFATLLTKFEQDAPLGPDGKKGRNSSLLASLEFSRRHLSPAARAALPWLGLFSGGVFEGLLLGLSQLTPDAWEPIRRELQSIALVRPEDGIQIGEGHPFLRFHPTLASAAADGTLAQQPETRERFIHVYLALMQMLDKALTGSQSRAALAILDREEANYRTAVRWAIGDGLIREAAALGDTFSRYLKMSGRLRERDAWVTMLKDATKQGAFTEEAAAYEQQDAYRRFQQGDPQGAVAQLQALIERLRSTTEFDPAFQLAQGVGALGDMLNDCGASTQAIPILQEAVGLWEALVEQKGGQPWESLLATDDHAKAATVLGNLSATMGNLANALSSTGQHNEALEVSEKGLRIRTALGNKREIATGHGRSASILMDAGRHDEADARYDIALAAARQAGDKELEGTTLQHQGSLAVERHQFNRAVTLYQQALQRFQEAGDSSAVMLIYNQLGVVEQNSGRLAEARAWYEKSRQLAVDLKDQPSLGAAAQNIGVFCQEEGEAAREQGDEPAARRSFQAALRSVEESLQVWQAQKNQPKEAASLSQLARIHLRLGDLAAADYHAHEARQIFESLGLPDLWKNYDVLSEIAEARGDTTAAAEWAQKRDAKRAELKRLAGGGGGLPSQMLQALQALAIACANAGLGGDPLDAAEEEALATLDGMPDSFPGFSTALRQLAAGQLPTIPAALPAELQQLLTGIIEAFHKARS